MSEREKRYAKVGDLVIHKNSGEMGRVETVYAPNEYPVGGRPVSCPVVVLDSGTPFLDVPGKTLFDFLPDVAEVFRVGVEGRFDDTMAQIIADARTVGIDKQHAMLIIGSVLRAQMRKEN